jgi:transcriptional regulator with XRE-family HTH domain/predicted negative regulator of RcsB-dependent stress response
MLNQKLRAARKQRRWSIETAAEKVGVSWVTYSRWERGEQQPHPTTLDMLCDTFGMPPGELGFVSENNLHETESDEQMKRRELIKRIGYTTGALLISPQVVLNSDDLERLSKVLMNPSIIDSETILGLKKTTENYWQLRIRGSVTSPTLLTTAIEHLEVIKRLLQGSLLPTMRTQLCAIASETMQLTGRLLVDKRKYDAAQTDYKEALYIAQQSNNDALYIAGLTRLATVLVADGRPQEALPALQAADLAATHCNIFTLRAWLAAETAETQADSQYTDSCNKALEQAARYIGQIQPGEYAYGESFDESRLFAYQGACYMRLHKPYLALPALQAGLKMPVPSDGLTQSIYLDMATAYMQAEEIERACNYINQALDIIARLGAARFVQRVLKLQEQLKPWADVQDVKDLGERLLPFRKSA